MILKTKRAIFFAALAIACLITALVGIKPYQLKSTAQQSSRALARYLDDDLKHLSSIKHCIELSAQDEVSSHAAARECSLRLLHFSQPYHSMMALSALTDVALSANPDDHALRSKLLMAIAVTRANEKRIGHEIFDTYHKAYRKCQESWISRSIYGCVKWFGRPVVRSEQQLFHDLNRLEEKFAHKDLDDMIDGVRLAKKERATQAGSNLSQETLSKIEAATSAPAANQAPA